MAKTVWPKWISFQCPSHFRKRSTPIHILPGPCFCAKKKKRRTEQNSQKSKEKDEGAKSFGGDQRGASSGGDLNKICWFYWKVMMCQIFYRITRARGSYFAFNLAICIKFALNRHISILNGVTAGSHLVSPRHHHHALQIYQCRTRLGCERSWTGPGT